jgi:hypothetical protein
MIGEVRAIVARTALVMAFSWDDPKTEPAHWTELLLQRKIPSPHGKKVITIKDEIN